MSDLRIVMELPRTLTIPEERKLGLVCDELRIDYYYEEFQPDKNGEWEWR